MFVPSYSASLSLFNFFCNFTISIKHTTKIHTYTCSHPCAHTPTHNQANASTHIYMYLSSRAAQVPQASIKEWESTAQKRMSLTLTNNIGKKTCQYCICKLYKHLRSYVLVYNTCTQTLTNTLLQCDFFCWWCWGLNNVQTGTCIS